MAKEQCFIIAPISTLPERAPLYLNDVAHCEHVIDHLLAPAADKAGFEPIKPKAKGANLIHAEIVQNLQTASLVLCDMSGLNPNVFFELGIRTPMNKPICLTIDEETKEPPFDLDLVNHHSYMSDLRPWILPGEVEKLATHIKESATNKENALWKYFSLRVKAEMTERPGPIDKLDLLTAEVGALRKQLGEASMFSPRESPQRKALWENPETPGLFSSEIFLAALIKQAKKLGVIVRESRMDRDGSLTFFVGRESKNEMLANLIDVAKSMGVTLHIIKSGSTA
ncbi:MAG TPA: hypothetical protein VEX43_18625 [Chthoniobacterales bacterium]|nr:hypothetical protein [Chthoniobacterales bacterium]